MKHPVEDAVDVPQLLVEVERALELGRREDARHVRIGEQPRLEVAITPRRASD